MISSHDGELELLVYWTGTVSVVSLTGLGGTRASSDVNKNFGLDLQENHGSTSIYSNRRQIYFFHKKK